MASSSTQTSREYPPLSLAPRTKAVVFFVLTSLVILAATLFAYHRNRRHLLPGLDGVFLYTVIRQQAEWTPWSIGLSYNPFQGLGDFSLYNARLLPVFALQMVFSNGKIDHLPTFALVSLELFWTTYLFLRTVFKSTRRLALSACWVILAAVFPLLGRAWLWPNVELVPQFATLISVGFLIATCFSLIGQGSSARSLCLAFAVTALSLYAFLAFLTGTVLLAPVVAILGVITLAAADRNEVAAKLATAVVVLLLLSMLGLPQYILALTRYSAAAVFSDEMTKFMTGYFWASILFHARQYGIYSPFLVVSGTLGALQAGLESRGRQRILHFGVLAIIVGFLCGSSFLASQAAWYKGPAPLYFEHVLWPLYTYYAMVLIAHHIPRAEALLSRLRAADLLRAKLASLRPASAALLLGVAFILWLLAYAVKIPDPFFPRKTPIAEEAERLLRLQPGDAFRGSVATLISLNEKESVNWAELHTYDYYYLKLALGNDHRMVGFWHFDTPTLFQYSPYASPFFYLALTRTLARPTDWQTRNVLVLTQPSLLFLAALGVRLVVSDTAIPSVAEPRRTQDWRAAGKSGRLFLYDVGQPNTGNYSPVLATEVSDATDALRRLRGNLDFTRETLVERGANLPSRLVPAGHASMRMLPGMIRVQASSAGASLLLLPFQFSHCLENVTPQPGVRLLRANLIETAVLFQGELDLTLKPAIDPFSGGACRARDLEDAERMRLYQAAQAFPLVGDHVKYR